MLSYNIQSPEGVRVPLLLSVPHCGTRFPEEIKGQYVPDLIEAPDDTDWFVNQLYDFAPSMGITVISGVYSRWVIDLNRDPDDKPLYTDGRIITGLCPVTNFLGDPIYIDRRDHLETREIMRRLDEYYRPYHDKLKQLLDDIKSEFGKVLLWDCHSIRQYVETIYKDNLPDLILGDSDGSSASPETIALTFNNLKNSRYSVEHNFPFKGGFITRHFGKPLENQQALQLEMSKINYMDDTETRYDEVRADEMRGLLRKTFKLLIDSLTKPH
jgi:N-formylglutamate deformylase